MLGFSLGGKVSMTLCLMQQQQQQFFDASKRIRRLIVGDISPVRYVNWDIPDVIKGIKNVPLDVIMSRTDAEKYMTEKIPNWLVRTFLLSNLVFDGLRWSWRCNWQAVESHLDHIAGFPYEHEAPTAPFNNPVMFIKGMFNIACVCGLFFSNITLLNVHRWQIQIGERFTLPRDTQIVPKLQIGYFREL